MRDAVTTQAIFRDRGSRGLPWNDVYRQLFNPDLFLLTYGKIYPKDGAVGEWGSTRRPLTECPWRRSGHHRLSVASVSDGPAPPGPDPQDVWEIRPLGVPTWRTSCWKMVVRPPFGSVLRAAVQGPISRLSASQRL